MAQQSFSIYLLKEGYTPNNCFEDHYLDKKTDKSLELLSENIWDNQKIPEAMLYLQNSFRKPPVWKDYFGIKKDIQIESQGSILILPIEIKNNDQIITRYFAITFGHSYHAIKKSAIDYNFGLITTLNSLDSGHSIRTIDTVFPETSKRERVQSPIFTSLSFFQFNKHESLLKSLQGKVKKEYQDIFNNITGTKSFKCTSGKSLNEIKDLCVKLYNIFSLDDYKQTFPELTYIKPEIDPDKIIELDGILLDALKDRKEIILSIPDLLDSFSLVKFELSGIDDIPQTYDDFSYENYQDYLNQSKFDYQNFSLKDLKQEHYVKCLDINNSNNIIQECSIYECISFDCIDSKNETYHLCDGNWYKINRDYIKHLKDELDPIFMQKHNLLSDYHHQNEGDYNLSICSNVTNSICLDKTNISPKGQTQIEPCDIFYLENDKLHFIHIKIDTRSSSLSHLFNQGINSICLLRSNDEAIKKFKDLISSNKSLLDAFDKKEICVIYGIVSNKDPANLSDNLPLFSRISLLRSLEQYKLLHIKCNVVLIPRK